MARRHAGHGRDLAALVFGAAAWRLSPRDHFLGWSEAQRTARLPWVVGNHRFLLLPHVRVPHLASHVPAGTLRRLRADWTAKYRQPLVLVESFVERARFAGTGYRAANWQLVGRTPGRSWQDRFSTLAVPVKDLWVFPLVNNFHSPSSPGGKSAPLGTADPAGFGPRAADFFRLSDERPQLPSRGRSTRAHLDGTTRPPPFLSKAGAAVVVPSECAPLHDHHFVLVCFPR